MDTQTQQVQEHEQKIKEANCRLEYAIVTSQASSLVFSRSVKKVSVYRPFAVTIAIDAFLGTSAFHIAITFERNLLMDNGVRNVKVASKSNF
jgi:hypothetical protein